MMNNGLASHFLFAGRHRPWLEARLPLAQTDAEVEPTLHTKRRVSFQRVSIFVQQDAIQEVYGPARRNSSGASGSIRDKL
jgi:hypothetical protein